MRRNYQGGISGNNPDCLTHETHARGALAALQKKAARMGLQVSCTPSFRGTYVVEAYHPADANGAPSRFRVRTWC